jgi:pyruvate/2-oxoglutarate/acetoin dehydrogenase E1 component
LRVYDLWTKPLLGRFKHIGQLLWKKPAFRQYFAEVSARIMEKVFYDLDVPVQRLCGAEVPIPYANHLEEAAIPQVNDIINTVKKIIHHD